MMLTFVKGLKFSLADMNTLHMKREEREGNNTTSLDKLVSTIKWKNDRKKGKKENRQRKKKKGRENYRKGA